MRTDELDYPLPESLIATRPAEPRDSARLLVHHVGRNETEHRRVSDLPAYLEPNDVLVFNASRVVPARLIGARVDSGGRVEGLYLDALPDRGWRCMLKSNGRLRTGVRIELVGPRGGATTVIELIERDGAGWIVRADDPGDAATILERVGHTPLPPYILRARAEAVDDATDRAWYQTVYATAAARSVAAPTAGLHFTPTLLDAIDAAGATRTEVILHVGAGTFKPVTADDLRDHDMHSEQYEVPDGALDALEAAVAAGGRRIAVGTTTVRALESATRGGGVRATDLLIEPGYVFRRVDALMTNFHLPRSTLLALVAALTGLDRLKAIYAEAVDRGYRFYSYGDAMLVLP